MEAAPNLVLVEPQSAEQCELLRQRLVESRQQTADALTRLDTFRQAVRATVIENIKDSTICRAGANEALESWGEEPYLPRFNVRLELDVTLTMNADDEDDARYRAYNALTVDSDEYDVYVNETNIRDVDEIDE